MNKTLIFHRPSKKGRSAVTLTAEIQRDGTIHCSPEFFISWAESAGYELQREPDPEKDRIWRQGFESCKEFMLSRRLAEPPKSPYA